MAHLIDKDALVAEIEKLRKNAWESFQKGNSTEEQYYIRCGVIQDILASLNTLEVKEVDLEKEVIDWWNTHYSNKNYTFEKCNGHYLENYTVIKIARHFFELGLKAQKGEYMLAVGIIIIFCLGVITGLVVGLYNYK